MTIYNFQTNCLVLCNNFRSDTAARLHLFLHICHINALLPFSIEYTIL